MEVTRIFDLIPRYKNTFSDKDDALAGKEDGKWIKHSINTYIETADNISYAFLKLGVQKGDKIATITQNRPEWNFLDTAILQVGAVHVPIYPTISESDYKYILKHAEVKFVFVAGLELLKKIEHILPEIPSLKGYYTFRQIDAVKHLNELVEIGKQNPQPEKLETIKQEIKTDDVATLIYTSGTTGNPKGVMLTHKNILSQVFALHHIFPVDETSRCLSYLPVSHVYERTNIYIYQYLGVSIYYAENMGTIADNLKEIKPHIFTTVPRLLEKVYDKIIAKGRKLKGIKKSIFFWAVNLGLRYDIEGKGWIYQKQLALANKLVFSKWREALGGNIRVIVSGGAALQPRLSRVYSAAGIQVLEGYGLTETSPVIAVNTFNKGERKFGTVGKPIEQVQVKIAGDQEILVKGPNVMQGYYKEPDLTKEAIDAEGWFHTGDLGQIDEKGLLRITGRKKALFKTAMGKYISPEHIENKLVESPFIDAALVIGENQKFAAALIVPDFVHLRSYCGIKNITYASDAEVVKNPEIKKRFHKEVMEVNKHLGSYEQIRKFELMEEEWSIQTRELTANLKLRRNYIYEKYKEVINRIFNIEDIAA
ncbi:MAG: long-chain fatty acid--CoA ligase [Bacteroidales bacterium]|nr:long-chain fatty acid--CoA ligase [Bacteroidales bacterium]